jgi:hypothetical protein
VLGSGPHGSSPHRRVSTCTTSPPATSLVASTTQPSIFTCCRRRSLRAPVAELQRHITSPNLGFSRVQKGVNRRWFLESDWEH